MVNKWIGIGNVTRQPELTHTPQGVSVCKFGIACNERYKDKEGVQQESVEFVNVVAWRGLADVCAKFLEQGKQVYIEGKMKTSNWEKDGVKHYKTEIVASEMKMLGGKSDSNQNQSSQSNQGSTQSSCSSWGSQPVQQTTSGYQSDNQQFNPDDDVPF